MLLPSALPCKQPVPPTTTTAMSTANATSSSSTANPYILRSNTSYNNTRTRTAGNRAATALSSPPSSSDEIATTATNHLFRSCRALQNMLTTPSATATNTTSATAVLGSPIRFAPASGIGRRIGRTGAGASAGPSRRTVAPRGVRKRRREVTDINGDEDRPEEDEETHALPPQSPWLTRSRTRQQQQQKQQKQQLPPHTPLSSTTTTTTTTTTKRPRFTPSSPPIWTPADDSALIALVLQKLRLSRGDWAGCAKGLGLKGDRGARDAGRRWRLLVEGGRVGLIGGKPAGGGGGGG
jgi:hypothetical protein